jgi:hypothetical protein
MTDEASISGRDTRAFALVADILRARPVDADRVARSLAPDGPGPGRRFLDGGRPIAYQQRFAAIDELAVLLDAGHEGALSFSLEVLAELDPEAALPAVAALLADSPDNALGPALSRILSACESERSFRLLVDHPTVPYLRDGLRGNRWPGGVNEAWEILKSVDLHAPSLDPHLRVQTLPALAYLLRHDRARALDAARALLSSPHANADVAHLLHHLHPEGPAALLGDLATVVPGARLAFSQQLAIRVLLERDPTTVVDALGGESFLCSPDGRPRLHALAQWLRGDTWARPQDGGSRGWITADPRFARLLTELKSDADRALASLARDLLAKLPKDLRSKPLKRAKQAPPAQIAPDPALLAELTAMREALTRLVHHLQRTSYRFASPTSVLVAPRKKDLAALARLEKQFAVPSALAALWRTIGGIDLRGQDPHWPLPAYLGFSGAKEPVWQTDPLVIAPAADVCEEALDAGGEPPFELALGPDALGSAGFSAGVLTVFLPDERADPMVHGAGRTLLAHLRRALAWGGFAGFEAVIDRPTAWIAAARAAAGVLPNAS